MKLLLYFATLQVTETQLLLLLTQFHPPEFRWLWCLSELPCLFSLLYPRGEPARASQLPLLSRTHLSECGSSPWKTFCVGLRSPHAEAPNEELACSIPTLGLIWICDTLILRFCRRYIMKFLLKWITVVKKFHTYIFKIKYLYIGLLEQLCKCICFFISNNKLGLSPRLKQKIWLVHWNVFWVEKKYSWWRWKIIAKNLERW